MKKITVTDVTLKAVDGAKNFTFREKLDICALLDGLGLDAIELPAPLGDEENAVICRTLAGSVKNATVAIEAGSSDAEIEKAFNCVRYVENKALVIAMPVSTATMEYKYHLKASAMLEKISALIEKAKSLCADVRFVAQDAFRADDGFIEKVATAIKEKGATSITVSDEAGNAFPEEYANIVKKIKNACDIKVCVQPSDSLSLAVACAIEAIGAGADGVKTTTIGSGIKPDVFASVIRAKGWKMQINAGVDVTKANTVAKKVVSQSETASERVESVGAVSANSTIKEVSVAIKALGYELTDEDTGKVYDEFRKVIGKKSSIDSKELEAIIASTAMQVPSTYHLVNYVVNSGSIIPATANVTLERNGEKLCGVSTGDGPIDAAFHAIEQILGHHYELDDFQVHAVTKGREAVGSSIIRLRAGGKLYPGNGVSTDIVGACIRAFVNALNKIVYEEN